MGEVRAQLSLEVKYLLGKGVMSGGVARTE